MSEKTHLQPASTTPPAPRSVDRRTFVKTTAATVAAGAAGLAAASEALAAPQQRPESEWAARMQAPDDGKSFGWLVDTRRCFGCHGCEVACKAENDVPLGSFIRQTIYHDFRRPASLGGGMARVMVPMQCQHCEDAPCIKVCPCGALHKGAGGSVQIDYDTCCGHANCVDACPYGAIYIDPVANQAVKCHNCTHRIEQGMEPACVTTCPSEALYFGDLSDPDSAVSKATKRLAVEARVETLRPEKGTRPRTRFVTDSSHPMAEWEPKVPREGESFGPDAYSVYEWKSKTGAGRKKGS